MHTASYINALVHDFVLIAKELRVKIAGPSIATNQECRVYILCVLMSFSFIFF